MKEKKEYLELAQYAVEQARKAGAEAEAFVSETESVQIMVASRQVEQMNAVREAGIGIRVLRDGRQAFGSTNDLERASLKTLIEDLVRKAAHHTADEFNVIPGGEDGILEDDLSALPELDVYDAKVSEVPVKDKIGTALRIEEAGLAASPKVTGSMFCLYQDATKYRYLANSKGFAGLFRSTECGGSAEMSAADGGSRESGGYTRTVTSCDGLDPDEVGRKAAEKAVAMLGAAPIGSCELPMVVAPEVGAELLGYVGRMLSADEVQKGRSLFAGRIGAAVGSPVLTLIDDGLLRGGLATAPVDGEGIPRRTTPLIVDGVLKTYLYDCYCARKERGGARSTGSKMRSGYAAAGSVGTTNLYMKPGSGPRESVFSGIDRGFYLTVVLGLHAAVDPSSGDFSIPSAGFLIEKGGIGRPVRGVTVAGNLFELLKAVDKVGNDLTWFEAVGAPTFSVRSVKIGGK